MLGGGQCLPRVVLGKERKDRLHLFLGQLLSGVRAQKGQQLALGKDLVGKNVLGVSLDEHDCGEQGVFSVKNPIDVIKMRRVLFDRIVHFVLFLAVGENLRPLSVVLSAVDRAGIVFRFDDEDPVRADHHMVDLRAHPVR